MPQTHPNRSKKRTVHNRQREKQSEDQHILPESETRYDPHRSHRPHRMSREDMQKIMPPETDPDEPTSP